MPVIARFRSGLTAVHTATAPTNDLGVGTGASIDLGAFVDFSLADGTTVGAADRIFADTRTVNASTNDDVDLAGTLTDSFGATVTFVKVKGIWVRAAAANTQTFTVGAAPSNGWATMLAAAGVIMRPGAAFSVLTGAADNTAYGVTAGTGDLLRIANGAGASIAYDIVIVGTSA